MPVAMRAEGSLLGKWLLLGLVLGLMGQSAMSQPAIEKGFLPRTVEVDGQTYKYQVFVPDDWRPEREWPVIFFLHGAGERGEDGLGQMEVGLPAFVRRHSVGFQAVVVMPQCRRGAWWGDPEMENQSLQALEDALKEWNGDRSRTYLTGLSMGGFGVWAYGYKYSGKFAALIAVCGGVFRRGSFEPPPWHPAAFAADPYAETARRLATKPIWVFHGAQDRVVPVSESRSMVAALRELGSKVSYTESPNLGHNSWDAAFAQEGLIPWLLSQSLAGDTQ